MDILQPVLGVGVDKLLEVLERQLPSSTVPYHFIHVQLKWEKKVSGAKLHILCPQGDCADGIVVTYMDGVAGEGRQYGVVYAPEGEGDRKLAEALLQTRVIPWKTMMHFSGVFERHMEAVKIAAEAAGVKLPPPQPISNLLNIAREQALQIPDVQPRVPNSRVGRLTKAHLEEVWRLRHVFCESMKPVIGTSLEHNHAFGVFLRREDGSERIISMSVEMEHGCCGMSHTEPEFHRKGLNLLVGAYVTRAIAQDGKYPSAFSLVEGILKGSSQLGYKTIGRVIRFDISPGRFPDQLAKY